MIKLFTKKPLWAVVFAVAAIFATTFVACSSDDSPSPGVSDANVKKGDVVVWYPLKDSGADNALVTAALTSRVLAVLYDGSAPYPQVTGYWSKDYDIVGKDAIKYAEEGVISGLTAATIYKLTNVVKATGSDGTLVGTWCYGVSGADGKITLPTATTGIAGGYGVAAAGNDAGFWVQAQEDVYTGATTVASLTAAGVYYAEKLQDSAGSTGWVNNATETAVALPTGATTTGFWRVRAKAEATYKAAGDFLLSDAAATKAVKITALADYDDDEGTAIWIKGGTDTVTIPSGGLAWLASGAPAIDSTAYVSASNAITATQHGFSAADTLVNVVRLGGENDTTNVGLKYTATGGALTGVTDAIYSVTAVVPAANGMSNGVIDSNTVAVTGALAGEKYYTIKRSGSANSYVATEATVTATEGSIPVNGTNGDVVYYKKVSDAATWAYTTDGTTTFITPTGVAGAGDLAKVTAATTDSANEGYKIVGADGKLKAVISNKYNVRKVADASEFVFVR